MIGCSLPEVFSSARRNERIFFDDGRIAGKILSVDARRIRVEIVIVAGETAKLRGEKASTCPTRTCAWLP
ncbi:MAG: hypothetical protein NTY41_11505 [Proteobacteria bacterium]|nr:hypothetical protein [Pseudomonadota bacterium]